MTTYYKWMEDKISPIQGFKFPVKKGQWTPNAAPIICESGWHFITREHILKWLPQNGPGVLWEVEVRGDIVEGDDKLAATSLRLVCKVATPSDQLLREFACAMVEEACNSAEAALKNVKGRQFKDLVKTSKETIATARASAEVSLRFARGEATQDELDAAWSAAESEHNDMFCVLLGITEKEEN